MALRSDELKGARPDKKSRAAGGVEIESGAFGLAEAARDRSRQLAALIGIGAGAEQPRGCIGLCRSFSKVSDMPQPQPCEQIIVHPPRGAHRGRWVGERLATAGLFDRFDNDISEF